VKRKCVSVIQKRGTGHSLLGGQRGLAVPRANRETGRQMGVLMPKPAAVTPSTVASEAIDWDAIDICRGYVEATAPNTHSEA